MSCGVECWYPKLQLSDVIGCCREHHILCQSSSLGPAVCPRLLQRPALRGSSDDHACGPQIGFWMLGFVLHWLLWVFVD